MAPWVCGLLALTAAASAEDFYTEWRDHDAILTHLRDLQTAHPDRLSETSIGTTHEGRDIPAFHLVAGDRAAAPRLLLVGTQHAREWISPMACVYVLEQLLTNPEDDPQVAAMAAGVDLTVVPIANPDGYIYSWADEDNRGWRKNRRDNGDGSYGVDLNRNWDYAWVASDDPDWYTYPGPEAFSEPETRALRDLTLSLPDLQAAVDVHTPFGYVIQPLASSADPAPRYDELEPITTRAVEAMSACIDDDFYDYLASYGGYGANGAGIDWWLGTADVLAWGWELDRGNDAADILPSSREALAGLLVLGEALDAMGDRVVTLTVHEDDAPVTTSVHLLSRDLESVEAEVHSFGHLASDRDHPFAFVAPAPAGVAEASGSTAPVARPAF
ncbi:MAG: M14 family zinc carboxypeptidase [Planctomycetota bacterium]